jgi:3-hydroxyisobutyrate dehydrogenase-like beta-hydroxyacid dehydrogenase
MRVAFLGLGQMGEPMVGRLLGAGHAVTVWNRTRERTEAVERDGARVAATPAEAVGEAEAVITMLSTADAVESVVFGADGVVGAISRGQTHVEMSTIGPSAVAGIRARMPEGVDVVDAPVLGSVPQATAGTLRIFVGATPDDVDRLRPLLESMGTVIHLGGPGAGAAMKLVANSTIGAAISALGEALSLADALGLPRDLVLEILSDSPVGPTATSKRANIGAHEYPANFKLALAVKDLRLVTEEATQLGRELRIAPAALAWLERAADEGHAEEDYSAVVETIAPPTD